VSPKTSDLLEEALALHRRGAVAEAAARYLALLQAEPHHVDAHYYLGLIACQRGHFADGAARAGQALSGDPSHARAHVLLGRARAALGQHEEALASFDRALALAPDLAAAHGHRADVLSDLGRHGEAVEAYDRALAAAPDRAEDWFNRGTALATLGRHADAAASFARAIDGRPDDPQAHLALARSLSELRQYEASLDAIDRAVTIAPGLAEVWQGRGNVCLALKRHDDAFSAFDKALALKPSLAEAWLGRGNVFRNIGRHSDASAAYDQALALKPDLAEAWLARGHLFADLKRHDEALAAYDKALALKSDQAWLGRGNILAELKRYDEAFAAYDKALALKPDLAEAHFNEACLRLSLGELTKGWKKYEYRWQTRWAAGWNRKLPQPLWLGDSDIGNSTILIHAEQGFGDTLLGCRYIPLVAQMGARVVAEVEPPLKSLLKNLEGIATLIAQGEAIPYFDVYCPIMSLPLAFNTTMRTIPAAPYLTLPKGVIEKWRSRLIGKGIKVGIGWAGNANFPNDRRRSILLKNLLPALGVKSIRYFCLQKTLRHGDEELLDANPQIMRLDREISDFQDTAAIMMSLDLVISSDTSIVNLAGALGRPFWVLLHNAADWRWLAYGDNTPWYPTGRLFRQKAISGWTTVIDEVRAELEKLAASR
jgi:tetratricopeptide (TPR) repeat protein